MNRALFALPVLLLGLLSLPQTASDRLRSHVVGALSPFWSIGQAIRANEAEKEVINSDDFHSLQLENFQLKAQLDQVYDWLNGEKYLRDQLDVFRILGKDVSTEFLQRRSKELKQLLQGHSMAAFGRILYRDPSSWSSSCWIDVGEENNQAFGQTIIAKNSPVVVGMALVGIVEYVGKKQSRVRLITDSGLKTAVRAVRGSVIEREVSFLAQTLSERLSKYPELKESVLTKELTQLREKLPIRFEDGYFAKGEVFGSSAPYQRVLNTKLKGIGFNCDVGDAEGPARNLRDEAVLKPGDLLVTSGLDGVFPPGLSVAYVTSVSSPRHGAYAYELEAEPAAGTINDVTTLFVLPPLTAE